MMEPVSVQREYPATSPPLDVVVETAVCDECSAPATTFSRVSRAPGPGERIAREVSISRRWTLVVYACDEHYMLISGGLADEYGMASNWSDPDVLTEAVESRRDGLTE